MTSVLCGMHFMIMTPYEQTQSSTGNNSMSRSKAYKCAYTSKFQIRFKKEEGKKIISNSTHYY